MSTQKALMELTNRFSTRNYLPLPVVLNRGEGVWVWDLENKKYLIDDYDSTAAIENTINENTVAVLIEPIQGEAGIKIPAAGYLSDIQDICKRHNLLFALDEIQTGLGRTGKLFCYQHEASVKPDILIVGKALSGGVYPISAVLSSREVLGLFNPGQHGSTFGGNPLAAAVGSAALDVIMEENLAERSKESGLYLLERLEHKLQLLLN